MDLVSRRRDLRDLSPRHVIPHHTRGFPHASDTTRAPRERRSVPLIDLDRQLAGLVFNLFATESVHDARIGCCLFALLRHWHDEATESAFREFNTPGQADLTRCTEQLPNAHGTVSAEEARELVAGTAALMQRYGGVAHAAQLVAQTDLIAARTTTRASLLVEMVNALS